MRTESLMDKSLVRAQQIGFKAIHLVRGMERYNTLYVFWVFGFRYLLIAKENFIWNSELLQDYVNDTLETKFVILAFSRVKYQQYQYVETQLKRGCQTRTVLPQTTTTTSRCNNAKCPDKHFVHGFCDGNSLAAFRDYEYRRLPYRRVLERVRCNMRETVTLMTYAPAGRGRPMCGFRRILWTPDTVTRQPTLFKFLLQQDDFLRDQHGVLCVRMLYPFHVQPVQGL
jgi:hypothetical protein